MVSSQEPRFVEKDKINPLQWKVSFPFPCLPSLSSPARMIHWPELPETRGPVQWFVLIVNRIRRSLGMYVRDDLDHLVK